MSTVSIVTIGFQVVGYGKPRKDGTLREEVLSRTYTVRQSAEECMELWLAGGRDCWIRELRGTDDAGPL